MTKTKMVKASLSLAPDTVRTLMARSHNQSKAIREVVSDYEDLMADGRVEIMHALKEYQIQRLCSAYTAGTFAFTIDHINEVLETSWDIVFSLVAIHALRDVLRRYELAQSSGLTVDVMDFFRGINDGKSS